MVGRGSCTYIYYIYYYNVYWNNSCFQNMYYKRVTCDFKTFRHKYNNPTYWKSYLRVPQSSSLPVLLPCLTVVSLVTCYIIYFLYINDLIREPYNIICRYDDINVYIVRSARGVAYPFHLSIYIRIWYIRYKFSWKYLLSVSSRVASPQPWPMSFYLIWRLYIIVTFVMYTHTASEHIIILYYYCRYIIV